MTIPNLPTWLPSEPRKRRWLALALLVTFVSLAAAAVAVPALLLHRYYDENIASLSRRVSTQTAFNAQRPRIMEKLAVLKLREVKKMYLKGTSSALALAELQETVRTTIEANGGRVLSAVQGIAAKEEGAFRPVTANFSLAVNNVNFRRVLYALETREPYLFIDTVGVNPQVPSAFRSVPGVVEPDMIVSLEIRGYALKVASDAAPAVPPPKEKGGST
ncbi:MAG: type II secretion system protein GspM [Betaproteobacteria bacterium]